MKKVKILVVEDEVIIANNICDTLTELGYKTLDPVLSYTEAMAAILADLPDIALLDIQLSGRKTGIDVARKIKELYNFPFIFLTSNSDKHTIDLAKEVRPTGYLIKPFSKQELYSSIEIALHNFSTRAEMKPTEEVLESEAFFFIKNKGHKTKVNFNDILYLKSAHVYIEIILKHNQKYVVRTSLSNIIENLEDSFVRVHRGFIINLKYLTELNQTFLKVEDIEIPIGRKYKKEITARVNAI